MVALYAAVYAFAFCITLGFWAWQEAEQPGFQYAHPLWPCFQIAVFGVFGFYLVHMSGDAALWWWRKRKAARAASQAPQPVNITVLSAGPSVTVIPGVESRVHISCPEDTSAKADLRRLLKDACKLMLDAGTKTIWLSSNMQPETAHAMLAQSWDVTTIDVGCPFAALPKIEPHVAVPA